MIITRDDLSNAANSLVEYSERIKDYGGFDSLLQTTKLIDRSERHFLEGGDFIQVQNCPYDSMFRAYHLAVVREGIPIIEIVASSAFNQSRIYVRSGVDPNPVDFDSSLPHYNSPIAVGSENKVYAKEFEHADLLELFREVASLVHLEE